MTIQWTPSIPCASTHGPRLRSGNAQTDDSSWCWNYCLPLPHDHLAPNDNNGRARDATWQPDQHPSTKQQREGSRRVKCVTNHRHHLSSLLPPLTSRATKSRHSTTTTTATIKPQSAQRRRQQQQQQQQHHQQWEEGSRPSRPEPSVPVWFLFYFYFY